jgi:hypothetical protein
MSMLVAAAVASGLAGCSSIPLSDVPPAGARSSEVYVVREKVFARSLISQLLSIDGVTVARLDNGEYTKLLVTEGPHALRIQWSIPFHGSYGSTARFDAQAGGRYLFVSFAQSSTFGRGPHDYTEDMSILPWDWGDYDRKIEAKTLVPSGRASPST